MKKGRRLTTILLTFLFAIGMFTVASFADSYDFEVVGTGGNPIGTVTLTASDVTYDGQPHMITVRNTIANSNLTNWDSTIQIDSYGDWTTNQNPNRGKYAIAPTKYKKSGTEESETAPADAGSYSATVTVYYLDEDIDSVASPTRYRYKWVSRGSGLINFKINKRTVEVDWDTTPLTYDGTKQVPNATYSTVGTEDVPSTEVSLVTDTVSGDNGIIAGNHRATASFDPDDTYSKNYELKNSTKTTNYNIAARIVELKWYRHIYNNATGEPTGGAYAQEVASDGVIGMVYNATEQKPLAIVNNKVGSDKVNVVVGERNNKTPIQVGSYNVYAVSLTGSAATNYTLEGAADVDRDFSIIPRPVSLTWKYKTGDETVTAEVVDSDGVGYDYFTTYNGKTQEALVEVGNIPEDDDHHKATVTADVKICDAKNFEDVAIAEDRYYVDAGIYALNPKNLSDSRNYTFNQLVQDNEDGSIGLDENTKVPDFDATYTIGKLSVDLVWDPSGEAKYTYNGEHQAPTAAVDNLCTSDDEVKDVCETVTDVTGGPTVTVAGKNLSIDAGDYVNEVIDLEGDQSANYDIFVWKNAKKTDDKVQNTTKNYTIFALPVELKWTPNAREFTYDANTHTYSAEVTNTVTRVDTKEEDSVVTVPGGTYEEANVGSYQVYVAGLRQDGAPSKNYTLLANEIGGDMETKVKDASINWKINKRTLTVTVYDKVGYYGDDPATYRHSVKYTGLVNGDANTDNNNGVPGTYDANQFKDPLNPDIRNVVDQSGLKYACAYKLYGKPGKYSISASGLKSDNYAIKYVAGTLTIKDRTLSSELVARASAGNKSGTVYWQGVAGAAKYQVYISLCNKGKKKYTPKLYRTVGANARSLRITKLKKKTYYKYYVVALDGNGKRLGKTECHHFCTNNVSGKFTNPKNIKPSKTKVTVNRGKTYRVTATVSKVKSNKKLTDGSHTQRVRYRSGNTGVATVTQNGVIKGVGSGWCRVYVMAANGIWKTVEVTVN